MKTISLFVCALTLFGCGVHPHGVPGAIVWRVTTDDMTYSLDIDATQGILAVATSGNYFFLHVYRLNDGLQLWAQNTAPVRPENILAHRGRYFAFDDIYLSCHDGSDGRQMWASTVAQIRDPEETFGGIACGEGCLFLVSDKAFYRLSADDGTVKLKILARSLGVVAFDWAHIFYTDGTVYLIADGAAGSHFLIGLDAKAGTERLRTRLTSGGFVGLTATSDHLFLVIQPQKPSIYCVRRSDGQTVWRHEFDLPFIYGVLTLTEPSISGDYLVTVGDYENSLYCINSRSGDFCWQLPSSRVPCKEILGQAVIVGTHIYFMDEDGVLHCVEAADGKRCWTLRIWDVGPLYSGYLRSVGKYLVVGFGKEGKDVACVDIEKR